MLPEELDSIAKGHKGHDVGVLVAEIARLTARETALTAALENARSILVFADGLAVATRGIALSDLYASDCEWAQSTLKDAGCYERGVAGGSE